VQIVNVVPVSVNNGAFFRFRFRLTIIPVLDALAVTVTSKSRIPLPFSRRVHFQTNPGVVRSEILSQLQQIVGVVVVTDGGQRGAVSTRAIRARFVVRLGLLDDDELAAGHRPGDHQEQAHQSGGGHW